MGRSFSGPTTGNTLANWKGSYYHAPSDSYFTMLQRDGRFFQRRHQLGPGGRETNVMEKPIDFIIGSGNHARTFLTGRLATPSLNCRWAGMRTRAANGR